jgi:hypothetical protein
MAERHQHEFQCTECEWFNYPNLRFNLDGNYVIKCGGPKFDYKDGKKVPKPDYPSNPDSVCGHEHYRVVKGGVVTEDRHNKNLPICEVIHVMPSACSETKRQLGTIAQLRNMEAAGLLR